MLACKGRCPTSSRLQDSASRAAVVSWNKTQHSVSNHKVTPLADKAVIDAVMRAAQRSAAGVHIEMKRGINSLATITCVAPLLGFAITVEGIVDSFVGCGGEKWACLAA